MDYSKVMKSAAAEGLRVEDLVKQYFEAAEQVQRARRPRRQPRVACVFRDVRVRVPADGAAVPADRAGHGEGHPGVRRQRREGFDRGADQLPVGEDAAPPPGQGGDHGAGYRRRGTLLGSVHTGGGCRVTSF